MLAHTEYGQSSANAAHDASSSLAHSTEIKNAESTGCGQTDGHALRCSVD